jgi:hypothetical protein
MDELEIFANRLDKIGIRIEMVGNLPWVYLEKVNDNRVKETYKAKHGFCIGMLPIRTDESFKFNELSIIFRCIRTYI